MKLLPTDSSCSVPHIELDGHEVYSLCQILGKLQRNEPIDQFSAMLLLSGLWKELTKPASTWDPRMHSVPPGIKE